VNKKSHIESYYELTI